VLLPRLSYQGFDGHGTVPSTVVVCA